MADYSSNQNNQPLELAKPGWGATIGMCILCVFIALAGCAITSLMVISQMGYSGYSSGGLSVWVVGIVCAALYRSSGKPVRSILISLVCGIALGFVAVYLGLSLAGL